MSTLTTHICGLWGYKKAVPYMSGRTKLILSPSQCHQIVTRGTFKTEQGHTRWQYLDIQTRIGKELSVETPCHTHFPVRIQGLHHWLALDSEIRHADPPKRWTGRPDRSSALKPDGFYTQAEVVEWESVQAMPVFFEQLEGSLQLKSCSASLGCPQPVQQGV